MKHVERELRTGFEFERAKENVREQGAAARAREIRDGGNRTVGGMMKHIGCIPEDEYFRLSTDPRFGEEALSDRGFLRDLFKRHAHLRTGNL